MDGTRLVTASDDRTARVWRLSDGVSVLGPLVHPAVVADATFSPDGRHIATAAADTLGRVWSASTGNLEFELSGHTDDVASVQYSRDGRRIVTSSRDHRAIIWNATTGNVLRTLCCHSALVRGAAFSSDARWVVTAGPIKAGIWATTGSDLRDFRLAFLVGPTNFLSSVAFSPSGWTVAAASADGTVRTYDCKLCGRLPQLVPLARARAALG
jgi:FOG: WD40 repeat